MTQPLGEKAPEPALPTARAQAEGPAKLEGAARATEGERVCTACGRAFDLSTLFCPDDGTPLEAKRLEKPDPYVGQLILDHIEIERLAGVGAMGRVYRAFQRGLERDVAVKVLHRELSANKELVGRFIREAKLASRIVHPNVVQVHLAGQLPDGALYIVMEFLDGLSLQSAMAASKTGALPLERALHVALQLCRAVGEAHGIGIVHRDLKPENVMLVRRGDDRDFVKVLDFGIARANQAEHTSMATAQGLIFGTARYISPEGARGEPATAASDVYSLAVLFYQLLSGRTPFDADQAVGLLLQHIHETPPPLEAPFGHPPLPASIARVVLDNLAKHPDDRAASARVFGEQLRRAAREAKIKLPETDDSAEPLSLPVAHVGDATSMWNPPASGEALAVLPPTRDERRVATELAEPLAHPKTEYAEPDARARGLTDGGTLRLDTPPPAMAKLAQKPSERTLQVVSRPPELVARMAPTPAPQRDAAPTSSRGISRRWLWLAGLPLLLAVGLWIGRGLRDDPEPVTPLVPLVAPSASSATITDLTLSTGDDDQLRALQDPTPHPPPQNTSSRPSTPAPSASQAAAQTGPVRVTVGRVSAVASVNQPAEFTAVVFAGQERAGNRVEAANFTFNGEGMNTVVPAVLDGQGIFRTQLTFYKPGSYQVTFGGLLGGKPIGGNHRFTVVNDNVHPSPPLPGPNPTPTPQASNPPSNNRPPPKPPSSVQWL